jgi:hypothetical protein
METVGAEEADFLEEEAGFLEEEAGEEKEETAFSGTDAAGALEERRRSCTAPTGKMNSAAARAPFCAERMGSRVTAQAQAAVISATAHTALHFSFISEIPRFFMNIPVQVI